MTINEIAKKLFPSVYRTRNNLKVKIISFAYIGEIEGRHGQFVWDAEGNFIQPPTLLVPDDNQMDLIELIEGGSVSGIYKKTTD